MIHRDLQYYNYKKDLIEDIRFGVTSLLKKYESTNILGVNVFVDSVTIEDFVLKKEQILSVFNELSVQFPVSLITQSPTLVFAIEVWTHNDSKSLEYKTLNSFNYTIYSDNFGSFIFSLGLTAPKYDLKLQQQSVSALEQMQQVLIAEGFSFDDVIRQWNYIPDIIERITEEGEHLQNYQIFNDVRSEYYRKYKKNTVYPAATGIGLNTANVMIDFLAVKINSSQQCHNLANPRQIDAFDYSQKQLIGSAIDKKPPLFARAKFIGNSNIAQAYISGTASIIGEETKGIDDVSMQTKITIENIENLISKDNILKVTGIEYENISYSFVRVYVKEKIDFVLIAEICQKHYADVPILYVQADICRDNLLVEIECEVEFSN